MGRDSEGSQEDVVAQVGERVAGGFMRVSWRKQSATLPVLLLWPISTAAQARGLCACEQTCVARMPAAMRIASVVAVWKTEPCSGIDPIPTMTRPAALMHRGTKALYCRDRRAHTMGVAPWVGEGWVRHFSLLREAGRGVFGPAAADPPDATAPTP